MTKDAITFEIGNRNYLFIEDRLKENYYSCELFENFSIELLFNSLNHMFSIRKNWDNDWCDEEVYDEFGIYTDDFKDLFEEEQEEIIYFMKKVYNQNPFLVYTPVEVNS